MFTGCVQSVCEILAKFLTELLPELPTKFQIVTLFTGAFNKSYEFSANWKGSASNILRKAGKLNESKGLKISQ